MAKELLAALPKFKKINIVDRTEYDPQKCHDGGAYSFTTSFTKADNGRYEVAYSTSASFQYCAVYGDFRSCNNCHLECEHDVVDIDCIRNEVKEIEDKYILDIYMNGDELDIIYADHI